MGCECDQCEKQGHSHLSLPIHGDLHLTRTAPRHSATRSWPLTACVSVPGAKSCRVADPQMGSRTSTTRCRSTPRTLHPSLLRWDRLSSFPPLVRDEEGEWLRLIPLARRKPVQRLPNTKGSLQSVLPLRLRNGCSRRSTL